MWTDADINSWQAEIKPLTLHRTPSLREAAAYFRAHMLKSEIVCPLASKLALTDGHFFPLVCCKTPGAPSKGMIATARDVHHAFELIERGEVGIGDVPGCDGQRVNDLPLFLDVISSPHVVGTKGGNKRFYIKRYETASKRRIKVAVIYAVEPGLRPASFHTTDLDVRWLNQNAPDILWQKK